MTSFKIGESFREKARDLLERESAISEELKEELSALKDQSIIPFKTVRKVSKLLQENGKKRTCYETFCEASYCALEVEFDVFVGHPVYLHELFEDSALHLPEVIKPPRVSEIHCFKLCLKHDHQKNND